MKQYSRLKQMFKNIKYNNKFAQNIHVLKFYMIKISRRIKFWTKIKQDIFL